MKTEEIEKLHQGRKMWQTYQEQRHIYLQVSFGQFQERKRHKRTIGGRKEVFNGSWRAGISKDKKKKQET